MATWHCYAAVSGTRYLGAVEADTKEEAEEKAAELDSGISLCHQCAPQVEDPQVTEIIVETHD